jgi:diguanylate cyclase (GGDEF)-like protein
VVVRTFFSLLIPGGLIFLATALLLETGALNKSLYALVHLYPYLVAAAGVLLGWRFNRSRLVLSILVLAIADRALLYYGSGVAVSPTTARSVTNAVAILLPLNLAAISLVKERGIVTWRGLLRFGIILLQVLLVFLICRYPQLGVAKALDFSFVKSGFLAKIALSQLALLAFTAAFLLLTIRFILHEGVIENGFFWALLSAFFAFVVGKTGAISTIYLATAGLVLVISVVETSHSMAFLDELTGLPARRALNEALLKLGSNYTVAMLDIDHFKKFNDKYGHDVGDQALRMVASKLADVSGGGRPYRYGGEEFTILFPGKLVDECLPHLERTRKAIEEAEFILRGRGRPRKKPEKPKKTKGRRKKAAVTISIGVAERNEKFSTPQQVIKAADKALYKAKKAGRNRIKK